METLVIILLFAAFLIIIYQYRHIFSSFHYSQVLRPVKTNVKEPPKPVPQRNCPKCDNVMEAGYLIGPNGIYWSRDVLPSMPQSMPFFTPGVGHEPLTLSSGFPYSGMTPNLKAHRCKKCGIILVDQRSQDFGIV